MIGGGSVLRSEIRTMTVGVGNHRFGDNRTESVTPQQNETSERRM